MGFSMGGAIAQELALARPELVRSLVIVGSWCRSDRLLAGARQGRRLHGGDGRRRARLAVLVRRPRLLGGGARGRPDRRVRRGGARESAPAVDGGVPAHGPRDPATTTRPTGSTGSPCRRWSWSGRTTSCARRATRARSPPASPARGWSRCRSRPTSRSRRTRRGSTSSRSASSPRSEPWTRGRLASIAAVLAVAGVAAASLADSRSSGGAPRAAATTQPATTPPPAETVPAVGTLTDQLERLPAVAPGELRGRIHRRLPACQWRATDLATGRRRRSSRRPGAARCGCPAGATRSSSPSSSRRTRRSSAASSSAPAPREVGRIRVPEEVTGRRRRHARRPARAVPARRARRDARLHRRAARPHRARRAIRSRSARSSCSRTAPASATTTAGWCSTSAGRRVFVHPVASGLVVVVTARRSPARLPRPPAAARRARSPTASARPTSSTPTPTATARTVVLRIRRGVRERPGRGADARRRRRRSRASARCCRPGWRRTGGRWRPSWPACP